MLYKNSDRNCVDENNEQVNEVFYSSDVTDNDGCIIYKSADRFICCFTIIGQIEGHYLLSSDVKTTKYENLIPKIINADRNESIAGILLILNTIGGDIEAGLAISELISGIKKPKVSVVLGGGHSIGIPLAVSADISFIVPTASMTVHPVRTSGVIMGVPQQLAYFQNMQDRIISFVANHSKIEPEKFRELMMASGKIVSDFGTVLFGEEAVEAGIIDCVGSINEAVEALNGLINNC